MQVRDRAAMCKIRAMISIKAVLFFAILNGFCRAAQFFVSDNLYPLLDQLRDDSVDKQQLNVNGTLDVLEREHQRSLSCVNLVLQSQSQRFSEELQEIDLENDMSLSIDSNEPLELVEATIETNIQTLKMLEAPLSNLQLISECLKRLLEIVSDKMARHATHTTGMFLSKAEDMANITDMINKVSLSKYRIAQCMEKVELNIKNAKTWAKISGMISLERKRAEEYFIKAEELVTYASGLNKSDFKLFSAPWISFETAPERFLSVTKNFYEQANQSSNHIYGSTNPLDSVDCRAYFLSPPEDASHEKTDPALLEDAFNKAQAQLDEFRAMNNRVQKKLKKIEKMKSSMLKPWNPMSLFDAHDKKSQELRAKYSQLLGKISNCKDGESLRPFGDIGKSCISFQEEIEQIIATIDQIKQQIDGLKALSTGPFLKKYASGIRREFSGAIKPLETLSKTLPALEREIDQYIKSKRPRMF